MLIEFSVTNFRSFKDTQTFSMAKEKGGELLENTFQFGEFELLRTAAIYGANASGKSNFLQAMQTMTTIILESAKNSQASEKIPTTTFHLDVKTRKAPSEFECTFITEGTRFQYGFSTTEDRIHEEWLFAYPNGRAQQWFSREWNGNSYDWKMGGKLKGEKQLWKTSTRDNALFLSTAVQLNSEQLSPIYNWFHMTQEFNYGFLLSASWCERDKSKVLDFLVKADLGFSDLKVERNTKSNPSRLLSAPGKLSLASLLGHDAFFVQTVHKDSEDKEVLFDLIQESEGTQKMFELAGSWLASLEAGQMLLVDELHEKLHPRLVKFLVQLFHNNETNPNNAQLVFTTHDTSILHQDIFRRDQIWFCEKDETEATLLYPLTDFSPRKGRENLELFYLSGRYGAVPNVQTQRTF